MQHCDLQAWGQVVSYISKFWPNIFTTALYVCHSSLTTWLLLTSWELLMDYVGLSVTSLLQ